MSSEMQRDLITVYMNVVREVEGGEADFEELESILNRYGIEIDDDLLPITEEAGD